MRSADQVLATLACPVADEAAVQQMLGMSVTDVLEQFAGWLSDVFFLHPELQLTLSPVVDGDQGVTGIIAGDSTRTTLMFRVVTTDELLGCTSDDRLKGLVDLAANVTVICMQTESDSDAVRERVSRLTDLAGSPGTRWVVMEAPWLAAAVVQKTKPLLYPSLQESNDTGEPYFRVMDTSSHHHRPSLARSTGLTRRHVNEVLREPRSLPEKIRELSLRVEAPACDVVLATSFIPPVAHSVTAVIRYYCRDIDDVDVVTQLVTARHQAEVESLHQHVAIHKFLLILDRQQVEEYFEEPEYYQMTLTPDELDEMVVNVRVLLEYDNVTLALCPEAIDVPFRLEGRTVDLRGDRRNRSEPRPGRVNGVTVLDEQVAEELRREASLLLQLTEPQFKDKTFISSWLEWLASNYRRQQRRRR